MKQILYLKTPNHKIHQGHKGYWKSLVSLVYFVVGVFVCETRYGQRCSVTSSTYMALMPSYPSL
jgi:hypothetical protein